MRRVASGVTESLVTMITFKRLVSGVDSSVGLQAVTLGESRVADVTLVRFLSYKHQQ